MVINDHGEDYQQSIKLKGSGKKKENSNNSQDQCY